VSYEKKNYEKTQKKEAQAKWFKSEKASREVLYTVEGNESLSRE